MLDKTKRWEKIAAKNEAIAKRITIEDILNLVRLKRVPFWYSYHITAFTSRQPVFHKKINGGGVRETPFHPAFKREPFWKAKFAPAGGLVTWL